MRRLVTFLVAIAVCLGGFSLPALPAAAATPDIITLAQLRAELDTKPAGISGYFLTVAGGPTLAQQKPVKVKMTVLAVADRSGPDGALIMFRADMTDPVMQNIGGIAAGMSGSPLFIPSGGGEAMLGALSYGYSLTIDGLGLATPIEYMLATETTFPPANGSTLTLDRTVKVAGTEVRKVRVSTQRAATAATTVTVRPLFGLQVTGAPPGSAVYQRFARTASRKGTLLLPGGNGQCTQAGFGAPLEQGGSLGVYYTLGSAEVGGYGTVTYLDGSAAMAFGHPMDWVGPTDLFATNAWISGIWGSLDQPFKVGCAGQLRGALTQDRSAGVGVDMAATTQSAPATANVTVTTSATRSATAATQIAQGTFAAGFGPSAAELAVTEPVYRVANQATMAGSALTTTTVNVTDGTSSFTITRPDVWSGTDVLGVTGLDAYSIVDTLLATPGTGARITAVNVDATVDQSSRSATIGAVRGGPLQVGQNSVTVTLKPVGQPKVELPVNFMVPAGLALDTGLAVEAGSDFLGAEMELPTFGSLAATVEWLNKVPQNNQLILSVPDLSGNPVEVGRVNTDYFVQGAVYPSVASGQLVADVAQAQSGDPVTLMAMPSIPVGSQITLERRLAGSSQWQTVGTSPMVSNADGVTAATFAVTADVSTSYRASWPGNDDYLAWSATTDVAVSLPVDVTGKRQGRSWRVEVGSVPAGGGQPFVVQAKKAGAWTDVASGVLGAQGVATASWRAGPASVKVRAVLPATSAFTESSSASVQLTALVLAVNPGVEANARGNATITLRTPGGKPVTGVTYRVQRQAKGGWELAARGTLSRTTRLWLANGDYRVTVPKQKAVAAKTRQAASVSGAEVVITSARGGRGQAQVSALPPIPLRFTVQKLLAGKWLPVGGVRRLSPARKTWSGSLSPGRYRFAFGKQSGFAGAVSDPVRVR